MAPRGMHAETISWLLGQLRELDQWRVELAAQVDGDASGLERIEAHRQWLEHQIGSLDDAQPELPST